MALEDIRAGGGGPGSAVQTASTVITSDVGATAEHYHAHQGMSPFALGSWMVMVVAMMLPAALPILREIGLHSLWARRYRSGALFAAAYLGAWGLFGVAGITVWALLAPSAVDMPLVNGAIVLAGAAWGVTVTKRRCLKRCHRRLSVPPRGHAADGALLRFGLFNSLQCIGVCWPLMFLMISTHALMPMAGVTAFITWERLARVPRLRIGALILAGVAIVILVGG